MNEAPNTSPESASMATGLCATLACVMEATAPKPGNIHRGADFEDASYPDFVVAAAVIGPIVELAADRALGQTVFEAVKATQSAVATNTNLGTILLIGPLAKVPRSVRLEVGIVEVLNQLTPQDARDVYRAILAANSGGLGRVESADVTNEPPADLVAAMRLAADRDMVARQYAENFHHVLKVVVPWLTRALAAGLSLSDAIVQVHLELMAEFPDSLIARRRGLEVAQRAAAMARGVLSAGTPGEESFERALADFDFWLRTDGHRRNPGTTADLVAAGLFVALRDAIIKPPFRLAR
ncbi:MAG: triphosphoribosyl-dephospho-CoA synthase [Planctomycetia bacterium]|nr:triphosphoribosyl-dephospho-CoA synthase [Planctomycetia bacterium]